MTKDILPHYHYNHISYFLDQDLLLREFPWWRLHKYILFNCYAVLKKLFPNRPRSVQVPQERCVEISTPMKIS